MAASNEVGALDWLRNEGGLAIYRGLISLFFQDRSKGEIWKSIPVQKFYSFLVGELGIKKDLQLKSLEVKPVRKARQIIMDCSKGPKSEFSIQKCDKSF
ncbi:uncharacterized protein J3R85_016720 [Psidium guajava]|nr:uncharacterized protein J3R85_016720 [Psidium guajava]